MSHGEQGTVTVHEGLEVIWDLTAQSVQGVPRGCYVHADSTNSWYTANFCSFIYLYPLGGQGGSEDQASVMLAPRKNGTFLQVGMGATIQDLDVTHTSGFHTLHFPRPSLSSAWRITVSVFPSRATAERFRQLLRELTEARDLELAAARAAREETAQLRALMDTAADAADGAAHRLAVAARKIQASFRKSAFRRRLKSALAAMARHQRHVKLTAAVCCVQALWRARQLRRERRRQEDIRRASATHYDAILAFDSLSEFLSTREVRFLRNVESSLDVVHQGNFRIVAVVGLFDKGKTWLLNRLFGVSLPSGKLHTTTGLSFLWVEERRMLIIDSAGVQSPVSYRAQAVDAIWDARNTETLVLEMISRIAHHMIFVVSDTTWFEQQKAAELHQKYVQRRQHRELIVVHNLSTTSRVEDAHALFERQVTRCYDGVPSHLGDLIFTADAGEGAPPVHHIGLCQEYSTAGDKFNAKNREYLLQSLEHGSILGSHLALAETFSTELSKLMPKFASIEAGVPEVAANTSGTSTQAISVRFCPKEEREAVQGYVHVGSMILHSLPQDAKVVMKTRGVISDLGEITPHDVSFRPITNVFDRKMDSDKMRYIRVECPGVSEDDVDFHLLTNGVKIVIEKKRPINEETVEPVQPILQHFGPWAKDFDFDRSDGTFQVCEDSIKLEHGVLEVPLKMTQNRKFKLAGARRSEPDAKAPSPVRSDSACSFSMLGSEHSWHS
ncbi:unnamed protein product [Symbiodinium sp. CCMP2592]|nr:unnamed protein product [Symbiodinium sp. CCMP2592]